MTRREAVRLQFIYWLAEDDPTGYRLCQAATKKGERCGLEVAHTFEGFRLCRVHLRQAQNWVIGKTFDEEKVRA